MLKERVLGFGPCGRFIWLLAALAAGLLWSGTAGAANGDLVTIRTFSQNCGSGIGVGIAFDGTNIWYSCYASNPDLLRANPTTGIVDATYNIDGGLGALSYDATRNALWAGPGGGSVLNAIQLINLDAGKNVTGSSTAFVGPGDFLDDGLAFDATDDSLYISPDGSSTIDHYTSGGLFLATSSWAGTSCFNSGLAIGGTLLYEGSDGCNHIWVANKSNPAASTFDFASPGGVRDEDLECDPVTYAPMQVMWSMEAYDTNILGDGSQRRASVFEIQPGTCGVGGAPVNHGRMTGGGSVFTGTGVRVTHGFELHCTPSDGPNNLEVNWGQGKKFHLTSLASAACLDDPSISPIPPLANFDTYKGIGGGDYNGQPGATAQWTFTDAGEPGKNDTATLTIKDASNVVVLTVSGALKNGNQQAHS